MVAKNEVQEFIKPFLWSNLQIFELYDSTTNEVGGSITEGLGNVIKGKTVISTRQEFRSDKENCVATLLKVLENDILSLTKDGLLMVIENCNPEHGKRTIQKLCGLLQAVTGKDAAGKCWALEMISAENLKSFVKVGNPHFWIILYKKMERKQTHTLQEFLDQQQYSMNGISKYEMIFGRNFVSTGGLQSTKELVARLNLQKDQKVLDVGCGLGGSALHMAQEYSVKVLGTDLSLNMLTTAVDRWTEHKNPNMQFLLRDVTKAEFPANEFDLIYSRDAILHIPDKLAMFKKFHHWLKPGGKLFITDYCCAEGNHSPEYVAYIKQRNYHVLPVKVYGKVIEEAGFKNVKDEDGTCMFLDILEREKIDTERIRNEFLKKFSEADYNSIIDGWKDKIVRANKGDQKWGIFYAEK